MTPARQNAASGRYKNKTTSRQDAGATKETQDAGRMPALQRQEAE
jgi:hypothetical protein